MSDKTAFQSQMEDREVVAELLSKNLTTALPTESVKVLGGAPVITGNVAEAVGRIREGQANLRVPTQAEAIVMRHGYPALLIQNGDYEVPELTVWRRRLDPHRQAIKKAIAGVGRVELRGHSMNWVGTCWLVDEKHLVTNRHVADVFTEATGNGYRFSSGVTAFVDFNEEYRGTVAAEHSIGAVTYIETIPEIDMAVMRLNGAGLSNVTPLSIGSRHDRSEYIGVIGYPAWDFRNPIQDMARIFRDIYDVKRLAPGSVMDPSFSQYAFTHNCTTLGGCSGSTIIDIESGAAIGLHYAGSALEANYAVNARWLRDRLAAQSVQVRGVDLPHTAGGSTSSDAGADQTSEAAVDFSDRDGYQPNFLGEGALLVPLPRLNAFQAADVAKTCDGESVIDYRHFSVVMSQSRRLAYVTAVNVDGNELRNPLRKNFKLDPRLEEDQQAGEALYAGNDIDRGHLVRRLDPCWGTAAEAEQANRDSMYFPNIAPQHKDLNQKLWNDLEDHILGGAETENAKVSVFVGCVFNADDPEHEPTGIQVPMAFWKVVASTTRQARRSRRGRAPRTLQAQAFVLDQIGLITDSDLGRELIFGGLEGVTQVTVEELERLVGLDFGVLREADTFGLPPDVRETTTNEAAATRRVTGHEEHYRPLKSVNDIAM